MKLNEDKIALLEQFRANAQLVRTRKKTSPEIAAFAVEWENQFGKEIAKLQAEVSHVEQSAAPAGQPMERAA